MNKTLDSVALLMETERLHKKIFNLYNAQVISIHKDKLTEYLYTTRLPGKFTEYVMLNNLLEVLSFYPRDMIKGRMKKIILANEMYLFTKLGNITDVAGMVSETGTMFLSSHDIALSYGGAREYATTIHHELAHLFIQSNIDKSDFEKINAELCKRDVVSCNNGEFRYGEFVLFTTKYDWLNFKSKPGFASTYGSRSFFEDIATIAEFLFMDRYKQDMILQEQAQFGTKDIFLRKVDLLKRAYYEASSGTMNESYWRKIRQGLHPF